MSYEVGRRALDFLVENSGGRTNLEVDFFGGEPLLNWDTVKRLVAYARSIGARDGQAFSASRSRRTACSWTTRSPISATAR